VSRPFTRTHKVLAGAFPLTAGLVCGGVLGLLLLSELPPIWFAVHTIAFALFVPCALAKLHRRRRRAELDIVTRQRGWRNSQPEHHIFTEAEVDEIGRIEGEDVAEIIRYLGARDRGVQEL
jgi:uncharacterized membrane protein YfcA